MPTFASRKLGIASDSPSSAPPNRRVAPKPVPTRRQPDRRHDGSRHGESIHLPHQSSSHHCDWSPVALCDIPLRNGCAALEKAKNASRKAHIDYFLAPAAVRTLSVSAQLMTSALIRADAPPA